ncbi:MAG: hypothetical protein ACR2KJ_15420 [Jatrophihabitans sp.]
MDTDDGEPTEAGRVGVLVHAVKGVEQPGEVQLTMHGGREYYIAYSEVPLDSGTTVLVVGRHGPRGVDVVVWTEDFTPSDGN